MAIAKVDQSLIFSWTLAYFIVWEDLKAHSQSRKNHKAGQEDMITQIYEIQTPQEA